MATIENSPAYKHKFRAFYNGLEFPDPISGCIENIEDNYKRQSQNMIEDALRCNFSLEEQAKVYKEQLDSIAFFLYKFHKYNPKKRNKRMCQKLGQPWDMIKCVWFMNVGALLYLKRLDQSDRNGFKLETTT
ncbi:MAG: hypothetical protein CMQ40_12165 [Gammaproteobacteria bacterium]|nr:hypothetical protein [Gammaproteobacteria bacterium]|tara:strand:+ start:237 stop:632 length:396 start_codon:yes stop_codon:yes gene_type:complete